MGTLSNVTTRRGESNPLCVRFAPDALPEAKSSQTGVSVRYVPEQKKYEVSHFYVIYTFIRLKAHDRLPLAKRSSA